MKNPRAATFCAALIALLILSVPLGARAQTTYTWASSTAGGSWATSGNWTVVTGSGSTYPGSGDTAYLGDVSSGTTRATTYDLAGASASLGTLGFIEVSGGVNELVLQNSSSATSSTFTVSSNVTVSASAGTSILYVDPTTAYGIKFIVGNGGGTLNVASGGMVDLAASSSAATISGNVSMTGGTFNAERGTYSTSSSNTYESGTFTMSGGTLVLGATPLSGTTGLSTDNRFNVSGNFTASGGTIAIGSGLGYGQASLVLSGTTNSFVGLTSISSNIITSLFSTGTSGNQSLALGAANIGNLTLRASGNTSTAVKTITSTGGTIATLTFLESAANQPVELLLGSNLTLSSSSSTTVLAANYSAATAAQYIIDTGTSTGYTLDATSMTNGFVFSGGQSTSGYSTSWTIQGNGTVKAQSFNFNTGSVSASTTNISGNVTLQATGGNATANTLSGTGTIAATSTFLYSGSATSASEATLVSNRTIGALAVQNGFLKVAQTALTTGGGVTLSSGGLDLDGTTTTATLTLSANQNFTMTGGTLVFNVGTASDATYDSIVGSGTGTFTISGGTLSLTLGTGFAGYGSSYTLFNGFASGSSVSGLTITGYDTADYTATLSSSGVLSFTAVAVPEPSPLVLLSLGTVALLIVVRRRQVCRA